MVLDILLYTIPAIVAIEGGLRKLAPFVARKWPNSAGDVAIASVLRILPAVLGFLENLLRRRGSAAPLVESPLDREALLSLAQRAYKAYADRMKWVDIHGRILPPFESLHRIEQESWLAGAGEFGRTTDLSPPRKPPPMPLMLVLPLLAIVGCTPAAQAQTAEAIETMADAIEAMGPIMLAAYERDLVECTKRETLAERDACMARVKADWEPTIDKSDKANKAWCAAVPEGKGCAK